MKVLIADDDPLWRILLRQNVHKWGYEVVIAENGQQAWDILQARGAPRVAILDWQTVAPGMAMTDIGYFMGCGIGELGLTHEDELLDFYLAEMDGRGVPLTRGGIYADYRRGILHGLSTAVFSAAFVERTDRGDANFLSMARGACALALKHDSIGAMKEAH